MTAIDISLGLCDGTVQQVRVGSRDAEHAVTALVGLPARDLPRRVGQVFSLCGKAQSIAALRAIEAATGTRVPAAADAARDLLRLAEMLSQIAMRLALHWPRALGLPPDPELPRTCLAAERTLTTALFQGTVWHSPGAGCPAPDIGTAGDIIATLATQVHRFVSGNRLSETLARHGWQGFGALPAGMRPEHGSFTRRWKDPSVASARNTHGAGLAARLAAGQAELLALPAEMAALLEQIVPTAPIDMQWPDGQASATVETARGPLTHTAAIAERVIAHYRIDAPTEFNLRPGGPLDSGLLHADRHGLADAATLHILAIDPCVEFRLEIVDA